VVGQRDDYHLGGCLVICGIYDSKSSMEETDSVAWETRRSRSMMIQE
jgi:hypothetical protein